LAIGAWTHLFWDVFTHDPHMEFLGNRPAPVLLGRSHAWDTVLQYTSSVVGVGVVLVWIGTSAYLYTRGESWKESLWPGRFRASVWILFALSPVGIGGLITWRFVNRHAQEVLTAKGLVNGSARHMLAALAIELIVFAAFHRLVKTKVKLLSRRS